jgi:hypothetical protein
MAHDRPHGSLNFGYSEIVVSGTLKKSVVMGSSWLILLVLSREWMGMGEWDDY